MFTIVSYATNAAADPAMNAEQAAQTGNMSFMVMMVVLILVCFVLPGYMDKKQRKKMNAMLDAMQIGDEVRMTCGIVGKVFQIKEDEVVIKTGPDRAAITFTKSAVAVVLTKHEDKESK